MAYSSIAVANWFIDKAQSTNGVEMTPMKIQKLIYIAHGWHLGLTGEPLIDEDVQAWKHGPVIPEVYHRLKIYGRGNVTDLLIEFVPNDNSKYYYPIVNPNDSYVQSLLNKIWDIYGNNDGIYLSKLTHAPNTPWSQRWEEMRKKQLNKSAISTDVIRDYYKSVLLKASKPSREFG